MSWCAWMPISVSVKYNGGFLPDIILLTFYYYLGNPIKSHEEFLSLQLMPCAGDCLILSFVFGGGLR